MGGSELTSQSDDRCARGSTMKEMEQNSVALQAHLSRVSRLYFARMNALFDALHQLFGTHYRKLFSAVTLLQFLSL